MVTTVDNLCMCNMPSWCPLNVLDGNSHQYSTILGRGQQVGLGCDMQSVFGGSLQELLGRSFCTRDTLLKPQRATHFPDPCLLLLWKESN